MKLENKIIHKHGWMYDDVKDKKIARVQNKEDGSIISAIRFKNGNIRMKSKMSFESEQAQMAQEIFMHEDSHYLRKLITNCLNKGLTPIFELVGPENQIVLEYQELELVLLQIRDSNGEYLNRVNMELYAQGQVKIAEDFDIEDNYSVQELLQLKETDQRNIEGWIVTFEDGQMAKIKTDKYLSLHGLIGPDAFRENLLVKTILDGNIDDVISALVPGAKKDKIITLDEKVSHEFNHLVVEFKELRRKYFQDFREVRKDFAIKHSKNELFSGVMKTLGTSFKDVEKTAEAQVTLYILKRTNSLGDAKKWLDNL